jgi:hypothetical protein
MRCHVVIDGLQNIAAYLPKERTAETQKPRNTHEATEVRVFIARCWVTYATMNSLLCAATVGKHVSTTVAEFSVRIGAEAI